MLTIGGQMAARGGSWRVDRRWTSKPSGGRPGRLRRHRVKTGTFRATHVIDVPCGGTIALK